MAESCYHALKPAFVATSTLVESVTARVFRLETLILQMNAAPASKKPKKAKKAKNKALKKSSRELPLPKTPKAGDTGVARAKPGPAGVEFGPLKPPMTESTPAEGFRPWSQQELPSFDALKGRSETLPARER